MDTLSSTVLPTDVAPDPQGEPPKKQRHPWRWVSVLACLLLFAFAASGFVYLPYYAYTPGSATDTEHVIKVEGAKFYPSPGQIDYTTVRIKHLTLLGYLKAWRDSSWDVVSERSYLGNLSPSANKAFNLQLMGDSKEAAIYVALTRLGYTVPVTGGGAVVRDIADDVPAAEVLKVGDVITAVDGTPVHLDSDLGPILAPHKPGDEVALTIDRPTGTDDPTAKPTYDTMTLTVKLAARDDGTALIGISPGTRDDAKFDFPVNVDIDSGSVGGPSAGLAFTLGVIDALTPGDLTGGNKIATTGTISLDGTVGPIGGIKQKTITVIHAGAKAFLVPESEADDAREAAGHSDLKIVPVENVDDALKALVALGGNGNDLVSQAA
ncbi:MAG TPA: S16 family serine protease [Acidimicrobiales bacterium]|nr:S16 family serine protease [Acidimicrobiales bacterium]